jgi:glycine/D-amino acid oxidase-like deaminating enzyme
VLEAGKIAWGASGRNGGFCCIGSTRLSNEELLTRFGREETGRYFQDQQEATHLVRQLAIAEGIEIDAQGDGEIVSAHTPSRWAELEAEHEFFTEVAGYSCQLWSHKDLAEYGFRSPEAHGALHVGVGFGLNPMKYTVGLAEAAQRHGVILFPHSPVTVWEKSGEWHLLHTPGGTVKAKRVIVATNGYTRDELHTGFRDRLLPAMSNIITTRPLTLAELEAQGWHTETPIYDTRNLLFYYRLLKDGRFLFGSRGGTVGDLAECDRRRRWMTRRLGEMFPAWREVEITHYWNGLVCLSAALVPHIGALTEDPSVFYALAYHGNGVATGTWSGRAIAQIVAGQTQIQQLCAVVRQPLKAFPLPALRVWYLRGAYLIYGMKDAWT